MEDIRLRSKIIETLCIFWGFHLAGFSSAILGPTLLDLQHLLHKNMDSMAYVFLANGTGALLGSLLSPILPRKVNLRLLIGGILLLGSVFIMITPLVHRLEYVIFTFLVGGILRGMCLCHLLDLCNKLWEDKGIPFQFVTSGAASGSIMVPLVSDPFLCHTGDDTLTNSSFHQSAANHSLHEDAFAHMHNSSDSGGFLECVNESRVHFAYLISGLIVFPAGLLHLYYWFQYRKGTTGEKDSYVKFPNEDEKTRLNFLYTAFMVGLFLFLLPGSGILVTYSNLLTALGVTGPLRLPKHEMTQMTSVFWFCVLAGRILFTMLTRFVTVGNVMAVNLIGMAVSSITLATLSSMNRIILWVFSSLLGFCASSFTGATFAWANQHVDLKPKVISLCFAALGTGSMLLPFSGGLFFEYFGPFSFLYFIISLVFLMMSMFITLKFIGGKFNKDRCTVIQSR